MRLTSCQVGAAGEAVAGRVPELVQTVLLGLELFPDGRSLLEASIFDYQVPHQPQMARASIHVATTRRRTP